MSANRRSLLQVEMLIQLNERPAKTITELAEWLKTQRPSVSRSLQILKQQDLVRRTHAGWCLTEAGRQEAEEAKIVVSEMVKDVQSAVLRTHEMIGRLSTSFLDSASVLEMTSATKAFSDRVASYNASRIASMRLPVLDMMKQISQTPQVTDILQSAIEPLLEVQQYNRKLMGEVLHSGVSAYLGEFASKNNLLLAHITDNMFEIGRLSASIIPADKSLILRQATRVNLALDGIWQETARDLVSLPVVPPDALHVRVTVPTFAVAHYSDAVTFYVGEEASVDQTLLAQYSHEEEYLDPDLDPLLARLDPDFVDMRRGSWSALASGRYDKLRHAATSQRELVRQVFQMLVPDVQLPEDLAAGKPHVKARVKAALGGSKTSAEFAIAMADAVCSLYEQLNKFTHHNQKHETILQAVLRSGEGLLLFILSEIDVDKGG